MSQAGIVDVEASHPQIPTMFVTNMGTAIPIANTLEILGTVVAAHSIPVQTTGSGNTVTVQVQYASAAGSSIAANAGLASFATADFIVDANGFVTLTGTAGATDVQVDTFTPPGTNPVAPNGSGVITVTGGQVAAGTTANVIRTNSLAANSYTIQIQRSQAVAVSTIGDNGVSHFNSTYFSVDANGFVSISGSTIGQTITGNTGPAISPTAGNWGIVGTGSLTSAGSGSTLTFSLTGLNNHAVLVGAGTATVTNVGPTATAGQVLQSAGSSADPAFSTATYPSTTTINQVLYSSSANVVGGITAANNGVLISGTTGIPSWLANGTTGQVLLATTGSPASWGSVSSAGAITTITGNSGGAEVPTAGGNFNLLGTGSITVAGSANTETVQLTGLTNHAIQIGAGTATLTQLGAGTTGQVLQTNTTADPTWSTATYPSVGTSTGSLLRADGTNWVATTSTYPNTNAVSTLLYASSANVMAALATANGGVLSTSASGVPSIDTTNFAVLSTGVQLKGNNTNTAPPAGFIGEYISAFVNHNSPVNITSNMSVVNVTSISLTAGIWDISVSGQINGVAVLQGVMAISTTSATLPGNTGEPDQQCNWIDGISGGVTGTQPMVIPAFRALVSTTTTYYLVAYASFTTSASAAGRISATRVG